RPPGPPRCRPRDGATLPGRALPAPIAGEWLYCRGFVVVGGAHVLAQARPRKRGAAPAKKRKRVQIPDDQIRYTNVDMLKRFLSERGKIRARRMTGLSRR